MVSQYVKDWKPRFEVNQIVQGKIAKYSILNATLYFLSVLIINSRTDPETGKVEMSFRSGPVEMTLGDFKENQNVDGVIRKKETYGVFIQIKDTKISGLCHKSEVSS